MSDKINLAEARCAVCKWWRPNIHGELGTCCIISGVEESSQEDLPKVRRASLFSVATPATVETGRDHGCLLFSPLPPPKSQPATVLPFDPFFL